MSWLPRGLRPPTDTDLSLCLGCRGAYARRRTWWLLSLIVLYVLATEVVAVPIDQRLHIYLMDMQTNNHTLAESTLTYQSGDDFFVHVASFFEAVEFPIQRRGRV